jgi:arginyl-tRNA synthetase
MHIGHAYNAILADTMANLLAISAARVKRVSYHGDVGAHVGKSMWALFRFCDGDASKLEAIEPASRNEFMGKMYAEGARAYKEDETVKAEIDELARQSFDREDALYRTIYETVFAWSFEEIDRTVARLGNQPIERRYLESEADPIGVETVRAHVPEVFQESDGALIFPGSKYGAFDNAFVGSNGRGLYAARDLGLIQLKARDYPEMTKSIVVTGESQGREKRPLASIIVAKSRSMYYTYVGLSLSPNNSKESDHGL